MLYMYNYVHVLYMYMYNLLPLFTATHVPASRKKVADEDDDLRELAAWATS